MPGLKPRPTSPDHPVCVQRHTLRHAARRTIRPAPRRPRRLRHGVARRANPGTAADSGRAAAAARDGNRVHRWAGRGCRKRQADSRGHGVDQRPKSCRGRPRRRAGASATAGDHGRTGPLFLCESPSRDLQRSGRQGRIPSRFSQPGGHDPTWGRRARVRLASPPREILQPVRYAARRQRRSRRRYRRDPRSTIGRQRAPVVADGWKEPERRPRHLSARQSGGRRLRRVRLHSRSDSVRPRAAHHARIRAVAVDERRRPRAVGRQRCRVARQHTAHVRAHALSEQRHGGARHEGDDRARRREDRHRHDSATSAGRARVRHGRRCAGAGAGRDYAIGARSRCGGRSLAVFADADARPTGRPLRFHDGSARPVPLGDRSSTRRAVEWPVRRGDGLRRIARDDAASGRRHDERRRTGPHSAAALGQSTDRGRRERRDRRGGDAEAARWR